MYIDTHCHLQFELFDADRAMVIGNAKKAGVKKFIVPGVDTFSSNQACELSRKHPGVIFASIGFHPYEASHNPDLTQISKFLSHNSQFAIHNSPTIVAIGEIGLDYHLFKGEEALGKKQEQRLLFEEQLRIALSHNLPVIMHCRDAFEDFFKVLDALPSLPRGVIHCFSGGLQEVRMARNRHLFIGLDGNITYSKQLRHILPEIPLDMILLETDAPYLTPIPHRGSRNEPKHIPLIAHSIADIYGVNDEQIAKSTTLNAQTLFHGI